MIRRPRCCAPLLLCALAWGCAADRPAVPADDVEAARLRLDEERAAARTDPTLDAADRARRLIALGLWDEAEAAIAGAEPSPAAGLAAAELAMRRHRYEDAAARVEAVLADDPGNREARLLRARLDIQAWDLPAAAAAAEALLRDDDRDEVAALLLGRVRLLEKRFPEALEWAGRVQRWNRRNAGAYLLEADVRFWDQDPAGAEAPLVRALELDPFDPDARFSYGYAIWRRVDATQLDAMAAHWKLALEVDPLHYITHWHWGNGHTNLTYADYAHPSDSIVRERLAEAHRRIAADEIEAAIGITRALEREFPESVLPALTRGSAFYMAYDMDRVARLDSAESTFRAILERKANYGPAHNGLAAVIKQRQFLVLGSYDSLEAVIAAEPAPADPVFDAVFKDVDDYPGDRVRKMARRQLGPSIAYVPFLHRLGRSFTVPPLHIDLAEAMGQTRLRTQTTFDNRQWMDIRGIGGGAAGIEYVERGSHWERNVLLHEYVHLFHGQVLTDAEARRIRALYHQAMAEDRTLDYYASNNESEFFAQAYEAYLSPVKAHPLNHKAMNTRDDLRRRDPATFAFVDSLATRQRAYVAGDTLVFRSNWAQVYTALSVRARRGDAPGGRRIPEASRARVAAALLDTALIRDPDYLPAMLSYAALHRDERRFNEAERWIERAAALDPDYAPVYAARAELLGARAAAGAPAGAGAATGAATGAGDAATGAEAAASTGDAVLEEQAALYRQALEREQDLAERARLNQDLRTLYADHARIAEAIATAAAYVEAAPTISTYLRDRRDEAAAFAQEWRAATGHTDEAVAFFTDLVARKPQHYGHRSQFADALAAAGRFDEAVATLEEAQRILRAAGNSRADFMVQAAEIQLLKGDSAAARAAVGPVLDGSVRYDEADARLIRVIAGLGDVAEAGRRLDRLEAGTTPRQRAETAYTRATVAELRADAAAARDDYRRALEANPYHLPARARLVALLARDGLTDEAAALAAAADSLPLPLGPAFRRTAAPAGEPVPARR